LRCAVFDLPAVPLWDVFAARLRVAGMVAV
jgi:hypothetical protein